MLRSFSLLGLLLTSLSTFAAETAPIVLGQSAAFTGASGQFGRQMWLGAQTYFDEVNRSGGINGRKVEVQVLDDQYNGELAEKNTQQFLKNKELFALFGFVGTPTLAKALPVLQKARTSGSSVFLFSNRSGAALQRSAPYDSFVLNMRASYAEETEELVKYLTKQGAKKIAIFIQDDSYGQSGKDGVAAALKRRGLTITAEAQYKHGAKFAESMMDQAKAIVAAKPDAVISIASYEPAAAFIRDFRSLKSEVSVANISFVGSSDMLLFLKSESKTTKQDLTRNLVNSQVVPALSDTKIPAIAEYIRLTEKNPVTIPASVSNGNEIRKLSFTGLEGFLNAKVFVAIAKKVEVPLTQASFLKSAESNAFDIGMGQPVKFQPKNNQAFHSVYLTKVVDGAFVKTE
ncbi:MAG: ABC transporter substrate-binding protein [Cryobacterium sp.]|nr:ABC transporter substrate-binding protein [Oligoflexia bacterium]